MTRVVGLAVGLTGAAMLSWQAARLSPVRSDGVGPVLDLYEEARHSLPARGHVLYVATAPNATDAQAIRFMAQQALVPLVMVDDAAIADAAVTGSAASPDIDAVMTSAGLTLVAVAPGGVRVYRR